MLLVHVFVRQSDAGGVPGSTVVVVVMKYGKVVVVAAVRVVEMVVIGIVVVAGK